MISCFSGAAVLCGVVLGLSGCASEETQKTLAQRLSGADRVVFTSPFDGGAMTIHGEELKKLLLALEQSEKVSVRKDEDFTKGGGCTLDFFSGTNHLATIRTTPVAFWVATTPYEDKSGTLLTLNRRAQLRP